MLRLLYLTPTTRHRCTTISRAQLCKAATISRAQLCKAASKIPTTAQIFNHAATKRHTSLLSRTKPASLFHTTSKTNANPLVGMFSRLGARIVGRQAKQHWDKLPLAERNRLKRMAKGSDGFSTIHGVGLALGFTGIGWIFYHVETSPTGRLRYVTVSREEMAQLGNEEAEKLVESLSLSKKLYNKEELVYKQVDEIVQNLIGALDFLPELKRVVDEQNDLLEWEVHVVSSRTSEAPAGIQNAFVFPGGKIFVYDGIFQTCRDEAALAAVLAHEMSHAILEHTRENHSAGNGPILALKCLMTVGVWFLGMDLWASMFLEKINDKIIELISELPYSRLMEYEADSVGLEIAAAACYDSRSAAIFWKRHWHEQNETGEQDMFTNGAEFFSTHPLSTKRSEEIQCREQEMDLLSKDCGCSRRKKKLLHALPKLKR
jgi:Zn-dependent protease with chaperone function